MREMSGKEFDGSQIVDRGLIFQEYWLDSEDLADDGIEVSIEVNLN